MTYHYRAYTPQKEIIEGDIEAATERTAEDALYQAGFKYILSLKAAGRHFTFQGSIPSVFGIKPRDVIEFSRQLAALLESGMTLLTALRLVQDQVRKPAVRALTDELSRDLQGGSSFSQAISRRPDAFPYSYWQVVRASEQAGELESGLKQVADYMERQLTTAARIRRALAYPTFVFVVAIAVFSLLVTIVLPPMVTLFTSFDVALPWSTRAVIGFTQFFGDYKFHILFVVLASIGGLLAYGRFPAGRKRLDGLSLRLPIIGSILVHRAMGQFCRTAAMLLKSGLQLPRVMEATIQSVSANRVITEALVGVQERLIQGEGFSGPMAGNPVFPAIMVKMTAMAEQTGTVDSALATLADQFEAQTDQRVQAFISLLEPTLTIAIGVVVAFVLLSIVLPLYSILGAIR